MNVLVLGGTLFFGVRMVNEFLEKGFDVTIATRGNKKDLFGDKVSRINLDRTSEESIKSALEGKHFDIICDNICYSSNELKYLLDVVSFDRYILTSTAAVYYSHAVNTLESDFNPLKHELAYLDRTSDSYDVIKRSAEACLFQEYKYNSAAVRFPYVIGIDDYTKRLHFYVDAIYNEKEVYIDNLDELIPFVDASDAGKFLVHMALNDYTGAINASNGSVYLKDIISYLENKLGKVLINKEEGVRAPYNGRMSTTLNSEIASKTGFKFKDISFIYNLLDELTLEVKLAR